MIEVRCCCNASLRGHVPENTVVPFKIRELEDGTFAYDSDGASDEELEEWGVIRASGGKKTWKKTWRK